MQRSTGHAPTSGRSITGWLMAKQHAARWKSIHGAEEPRFAVAVGGLTASNASRAVERRRDWTLILDVLRTRGPLLAVLVLSASAALVWGCGAGWASVVFVPVLGVLGPVLEVLDVELLRLPNRLVLPAIPVQFILLAVATAASGQVGALLRSVCAAVVTFLLLGALATFTGGRFGWGDVKLAAGLLAPTLGWFSWSLLAAEGWLAFVSAALVGALRRRLRDVDSFAFGPYLIVAAVAVLLWGGRHG